MGVIFDLDQTLIESSPAEPLRRARKWAEVYRKIPDLRPYQGVTELLEKLNQCGIPLCIVTSSPSSYCHRVIKYWGWKIDVTVCYHDTQFKKPHPEPILLGISRLQVPMDRVVSVGDDVRDIIASHRAGIYSIAALWGANNKEGLIDQKPNQIFSEVNELREFLIDRYNIA